MDLMQAIAFPIVGGQIIGYLYVDEQVYVFNLCRNLRELFIADILDICHGIGVWQYIQWVEWTEAAMWEWRITTGGSSSGEDSGYGS